MFKQILRNAKRKRIIVLFLLLIILTCAAYWRWINFGIFINGDWRFYFGHSLMTYFFPSVWSFDLGGTNLVLWRYPLDFFSGLFGYLGFNSNISEKFIYFWPIILLAPLGSFLLVRKITKSNPAGFIGALAFSFNTYFLSIDTEGHELLTVAFCWAILAILAFIYLLETKKKIFIPLTALLLFIVGSYDLRSLYVTTGVIVLYAFYHQLIIEKKWLVNSIANMRNSFLTFFILALLNSYWIISFISAKTLISNGILSREILVGSFYNLQNVAALFYPFWTGAETTWFFVQKIPFIFWLYPLLAFIGLIVGKKNKQVVFFGLLALIGIFLAKQDSAPFAIVYKWFYSYIPGFSAFREASKFDFLVDLSYAVLIGAFADFMWNYLKNKQNTKYILILLMVSLPLWNAVPLLTGAIGTLFVPITNQYFSKNMEYSRLFLVNQDYYWIFSTNMHPVADGSIGAIEGWANQASITLKFLDLDSIKEQNSQKILRFIQSDVGRRMLALGSYGYIVVNEEKNDWTNSSSGDWKGLINSLQKISYLKQVSFRTTDVAIFKNQEQRPHIY